MEKEGGVEGVVPLKYIGRHIDKLGFSICL